MRGGRALLAMILAPACAAPIKTTISPAALLSAVEVAERERDGHAPAIPRALGAQQRELRLAALRALARTAEVGTSSAAMGLLGDRDEEVAAWAAFALGQIGEPAGEAALRSALKTVSPVPEAVLMALGRSGTATAARDVAAMLGDARPVVRGAAATALGLIAKRTGKDFPSVYYAPLVAPLIRDGDRDVRFGAVYALMRMPGPTSAVALIPALGDADPELRANAARGLGMAVAAPQVFDSVIADADWRVRVEVVRALGAAGKAQKSDAPAAAQRLYAMVPREFARMKSGEAFASGTATHVLLAIVNAALDLGEDGQRVITLLEKSPWTMEGLALETTTDLARIACAVAHALDQQEGVIRRVRSCGDASLPAWRRDQLVARLLAARADDAAVDELSAMAGHQDPRVRTAAVESLGEIERESAVLALVRLLDSNDLFVKSGAAEALSRPERARFRPKGIVPRLAGVLETVARDPDPGFAVGVLDAIGALGQEGRPLLPNLEALANDPRPAVRRRAARAREAITATRIPFGRGTGTITPRPEPQAGTRHLVFRTSRGRILVELFGDIAPQTTGSLLALASSRFYDDHTFHRIVSDFVAQGGCPRGDGYGGPGYAIDEEVSMLPFVRGAVGIATSGRDTGGSQFFFMHAYHPHLDGNYAVVGRVVQGMEVVDALQVDDRILEARPEDGRRAAGVVP